MDNNLLKHLLRLDDEPYIYVSDIDAHTILMNHTVSFMDHLFEFYERWGCSQEEVELPYKQVFSSRKSRGDFRVMPCSIEDRDLKFVKIIGTNEEEKTIKDKISVGKALLIDQYDNYVYAILDVCAFSSFRTAAISVLAMRLAQTASDAIGIIGTGRIGFYTAYILHRWLGIRHVDVFEPNEGNYQKFLTLCNHYIPQLTVRRKERDQLLQEAEAVFAATTSEKAFMNSLNAGHLKFVSSVGADADNLSEIDVSLLETHRLITDSIQSICLGDMKRWKDKMVISDRISELKEYVSEPVSSDKVLFISTGIALQDALVSQFIYEKMVSA